MKDILKSIGNIRSGIVRQLTGKSDVHPEDIYRIGVLKRYDRDLVKNFVNATSFDDYVIGSPPSQLRKMMITFIMALLVCLPLRFAFLAYSLRDETRYKALGDPWWLFGDRVMLNLCMVACYVHFVAIHSTFFRFSLHQTGGSDWAKFLITMKDGTRDPKGAIGIEWTHFKIFKTHITLIFYLLTFIRFNLLSFFTVMFGGSSLYACYSDGDA